MLSPATRSRNYQSGLFTDKTANLSEKLILLCRTHFSDIKKATSFKMSSLKITLKNFRCFADSEPLSVTVGKGLTALVGPNNSGKSSFLKFFYELRHVFSQFSNSNGLGVGHHSVNLNSVEDWLEIFHNQNERDLIISLELTAGSLQIVDKLVASFARAATTSFDLEVFSPAGKIAGVQQLYNNALTAQVRGGTATLSTQPLCDFAQLLSDTLYVGPFRNAINEGAGSYFDLTIGTSFIQTWNNWKNGTSRSNNDAAQRVADDIAHIFDFKRLDINSSSDGKTLQVVINGKTYRLRELGAGIAQFIIVLGNLAVRKPRFLLIDEPELNLHPSLQADFLTTVASYARDGVIFATHSIGLARTVADQIYSFQKKGDYSIAKPFEQTPNFAEFVGEMSFSSFKELGCEIILLVEGVTEVKAIQQFLRLLKKDHRIVVIPLGGSQFIAAGRQQELSELTRISKKVAVIIDSERTAKGEPLSKDRQEFLTDCLGLGFKTFATDRRAFENYLTTDAIRSIKGGSYQALESYQLLKNSPLPWAKSENWRIAREMKEADLTSNDLGQFLAAL